MPEFQRSWKDWAAEISPQTTHYAPDKTDKSPSVSFVSPIAEPTASNLETSAPQPDPCYIDGCSFRGHLVDLGAGQATRLCAPHRRDLFKRAAELAEAHEAVDELTELRSCRLCGEAITPSEDPCRACLARLSPLVQLAVKMGAQPLCHCGTPISEAAGYCESCRPTCLGDSR